MRGRGDGMWDAAMGAVFGAGGLLTECVRTVMGKNWRGVKEWSR